MNKTIKCGKCKKEGHNARRCKAGITGETPWQRRDKLAKSKAVSISILWTIFIFTYISCVCNLCNPLCRHKVINLQKQSRLQHLKLHLNHQVQDLSLHIELLVKLHLNLHQTIDLRQQLNLQLDLGPIGSLHRHNWASIPLKRHEILYHLRHLCFFLFCLFFFLSLVVVGPSC